MYFNWGSLAYNCWTNPSFRRILQFLQGRTQGLQTSEHRRLAQVDGHLRKAFAHRRHGRRGLLGLLAIGHLVAPATVTWKASYEANDSGIRYVFWQKLVSQEFKSCHLASINFVWPNLVSKKLRNKKSCLYLAKTSKSHVVASQERSRRKVMCLQVAWQTHQHHKDNYIYVNRLVGQQLIARTIGL